MKGWYVVALAALLGVGALVAWTFLGASDRKPAPAVAPEAASPTLRAPVVPPTAATAVPVADDATKTVLDCAAPQGDAATFVGGSVAAATLCAELVALGGQAGKITTPQLRAMARQTLDRQIDDRLMAAAMAEEHTAVSDREVDVALERLRGQLTGADKMPAPEATTPAQRQLLRQEVRRRLELAILVASRGGAQATDTEIAQEYAAHPERYSAGGVVQVQGYLARVRPNEAPAREAQLHQAAEDFAVKVAGLAADAPVPKGPLVPLPPFALDRGEQEPALDAAVAGKQPGQWTAAVRTKVGWMVAKILSRTPAKLRPLPEVKAQIRVRLHETRRLNEQARIMAVLRQAAQIRVLVAL